jgi:hypothetical protein
MARLFGWCTLQFGDPKYLDVWAASRTDLTPEAHDHGLSAALQFLPWIQAKLWQAKLTRTGIEVRPLHFGADTPREARILSPHGAVKVKWTKQGSLRIPKSVKVESSLRSAR